jgi:hypothetical protein
MTSDPRSEHDPSPNDLAIEPTADAAPSDTEDREPRKVGRPVDPLAGDPPDAVRGAAQALVDPPGDIADDETLRWDPRTVRAPTREGG